MATPFDYLPASASTPSAPFDPTMALIEALNPTQGYNPAAASQVQPPVNPRGAQGGPSVPPSFPLPPAGGIQELFSLMAQNPEAAADILAQSGVAPPTGGMSTHPKNVFPDGGSSEHPKNVPGPSMDQGMDVGTALAGGMGAVGPGAEAPGGTALDDLIAGFSGVGKPTAPPVADVSTPSVSPPAPGVPGSGGGIPVGSALGLGDILSASLPRPAQMDPRALPSTLQRALLGRA